jgi:hypothetical protein
MFSSHATEEPIIIDIPKIDYEGGHNYWLAEAPWKVALKESHAHPRRPIHIRLPDSKFTMPITEEMVRIAPRRGGKRDPSRYMTIEPYYFTSVLSRSDSLTQSRGLSRSLPPIGAESSTSSISSSPVPPPLPPPPPLVLPFLCLEHGTALRQRIETFGTAHLDELRADLEAYARLLIEARLGKTAHVLSAPLLWEKIRLLHAVYLFDERRRSLVLGFMVYLVLAPILWIYPTLIPQHKSDKKAPVLQVGIESVLPYFMDTFIRLESILTGAAILYAIREQPEHILAEAVGRLMPLEFSAKNPLAPWVIPLPLKLRMGLRAHSADTMTSTSVLIRLLPVLHASNLRNELVAAVRRFGATAQPQGPSPTRRTSFETLDPRFDFMTRLRDKYKCILDENCIEEWLLKENYRPLQIKRLEDYVTRRRERLERERHQMETSPWVTPASAYDRKARLASFAPDIEDLFRTSLIQEVAPPCMRAVLEKTRRTGHLRDSERYPMATWLMPMTGSIVDPALKMVEYLLGRPVDKRQVNDATLLTVFKKVGQKGYSPKQCEQVIEDERLANDSESVLRCPYADQGPLAARRTCAQCNTKPREGANVDDIIFIESPVDLILHRFGR